MAKRSGAFTDRVLATLNGTIINLCNRQKGHMRHGLSPKVLFDSFVREDDKDVLKRIHKIAQISISNQRFTFPYENVIEVEDFGDVTFRGKFMVSLEGTADGAFIFPKYFQNIKKLDNLSPKLGEYLVNMCRTGLAWGVVNDTVNALHIRCASPGVVKTVCPHIITLINAAPNGMHDALALSLRKSKDSMSVPALPIALRQQALAIGTTITKALLLPEDSEQPPDKFEIVMDEMAVTVKDWDGEEYTVL